MDPIDAYTAELAAALRGPRRLKADLVTEARDGLTDAAAGYQEDGLQPIEARRFALAEFGSVPDIAPDYQRVLGLAQGRRTALVVFAVTALQSLGSTAAWKWAGLGWTHDPGGVYLVLAHAVDWVGLGALVAALLALVACGRGTRLLGARRLLPRAVGWYALTIAAFSLVASLLLTVGSMTVMPGLVTWVAFGAVLPAAVLTWSARSCFQSARSDPGR